MSLDRRFDTPDSCRCALCDPAGYAEHSRQERERLVSWPLRWLVGPLVVVAVVAVLLVSAAAGVACQGRDFLRVRLGCLQRGEWRAAVRWPGRR